MSECNNRIRALNELCRFRSDVPPTIFETSPETEFSSEYFTEMLLRYIFGPSVVKYDILSNNRRRKIGIFVKCLNRFCPRLKLHKVMDFFFFYYYEPPVLHFVSSPESKSWGKNVWTNGASVVNKNKVKQMCF